MSSNNKWKSGFLKTGLPLEYVTSNILNKNGHSVFGEYPYIRPDETKQLKEFSVDMRTYKCLDSKDKLVILSTLIECKYRQPGTSWVFSPYPSEIIPIGLVQSTEDITPIRLENNAIRKFEKKLGYCISGIELDNMGNGKNDGSKHGIFQLRFAMPVLLKDTLESNIKHLFSNGHHIDLLCPILVTTAEIRVIKKHLRLEDFTNAEHIDDVTEHREAIILNETAGPQLEEFSNSLASDFIENHPTLIDRLSKLDSVLVGEEWKNRFAPDIDTIHRSFKYSTERILVVNYEYLEKILKQLEGAIKRDIKAGKVYGKIIVNGDEIEICKV